MQSRTLQLVGLLIIPVSWWVFADLLQATSPILLPPLSTVVERLWRMILTGSLAADIGYTLYRWTFGFSLGVLAGILVGLSIGISPRLRTALEFPLEFMRCMPVTAIFPLFLMIFGIGDPSKVAMAFTPTFLLMTVNTAYGVTLADPTRRRMAAVFGANGKQIFWRIVAMDALPQIFIGLRLSTAQSLIVVVVSEMFIGTDFGLGQRVYDSYLTNSSATLYALLLALGVIGYSVNRLLLFIEARAVFWTGR